MIVRDTGVVIFPTDRKEQADDLMALAGDALIRGDRIAWKALYSVSRELEHAPENGSPEAALRNANIEKQLGILP